MAQSWTWDWIKDLNYMCILKTNFYLVISLKNVFCITNDAALEPDQNSQTKLLSLGNCRTLIQPFDTVFMQTKEKKIS